MKKNKLLTPVVYDFELIGIVSRAKDHKLAWSLNQTNFFHFIRQDDIQIEFTDQSKISIGNFLCESDFHKYYLLKNKLDFSNKRGLNHMLAELPQFDYFLKIENQLADFDLETLISSVRTSEVIDYILKLNVSNLKQKDNLLF
jgi:hypothetical protein